VIAVEKGKKWLSGREGRSEMQFVWPRDLLLPGVKSLQMHSLSFLFESCPICARDLFHFPRESERKKEHNIRLAREHKIETFPSNTRGGVLPRGLDASPSR
jgi:hypothetical protein